MKITRIVIGDYHQFGYLNIDLTYPKGHPKEGKALDKVCFIGKNGTGKTTILNILRDLLNTLINPTHISHLTHLFKEQTQFCIELEFEGKRYLVGRFVQHVDKGQYISSGNLQICNPEFYLNYPNFWDEVFVKKDIVATHEIFDHDRKIKSDLSNRMGLYDIGHKISGDGLLIFSPTEYSTNNSFTELYSLSNLNDGLAFGKTLPYYHKIAFDTLKNFWSLLIYQVQQRERERNEFENRDSNLKKTKEELIEEFEKQYPEILKVIADKWKVILDEVGLYFDTDDVKKPIVLTDQLVAFIKDKKTKQNVPYSALSSGIKNLIFTLGYMVSLYFHRNVKSSTAIFDEPEFSLFPNILSKLVEIYTNPKDFPNTQFFISTHSPIIASQFEPEERVCLQFDEDRKVYYTRGTAPIGDDPNDILTKDFKQTNLLGERGLEAWNRFIELKFKLKNEKNPQEKEKLATEFLELSTKYNFGNETHN